MLVLIHWATQPQELHPFGFFTKVYFVAFPTVVKNPRTGREVSMKGILLETSRGALFGMMMGLLVGFFGSAMPGVSCRLGYGLIVSLGVFGVGLALLMLLFRYAVELGGLRRIAMRGLGGAIVGIVLGPMLYLGGWSNALVSYTIGIVFILTICSALNQALDVLAEQESHPSRNAGRST
jgi:hypothetical protein